MAVVNESNVKIQPGNCTKLQQVANKCAQNMAGFINVLIERSTEKELIDFYKQVLFRDDEGSPPGGKQ